MGHPAQQPLVPAVCSLRCDRPTGIWHDMPILVVDGHGCIYLTTTYTDFFILRYSYLISFPSISYHFLGAKMTNKPIAGHDISLSHYLSFPPLYILFLVCQLYLFSSPPPHFVSTLQRAHHSSFLSLLFITLTITNHVDMCRDPESPLLICWPSILCKQIFYKKQKILLHLNFLHHCGRLDSLGRICLPVTVSWVMI